MLRALYRTRQVWHALRPRVDQHALTVVRDVLNQPQASLFFAMQRRDQRHALEVARRLLDSGIHDRDLLVAALLHDCGKGPVAVWLRVAKVLSPRLVRMAAVESDSGWRGAAYRLQHHARLGARASEQAGASPLTVRLIRGDVAPEDEAQLALLIAADDAS